jgi:DNA-binding transcriptional ArsR family regulator
MTIQLLIEAIVQQTTVLLAKLATAGGLRAPLAHIAGQVFVELAAELERQGVSRKVTADMFGISLRAYQRKMSRLRESDTVRGRTLWEAVLEHVRSVPVASRQSVLERFRRDDEDSVRAILHDLVESGLVFATGTRADDVYRAATAVELEAISHLVKDDGLDELIWSLVFNQGPLELEELARLCGTTQERLSAPLSRLLENGSVERVLEGERPLLQSQKFFVSERAATGWEAAVYDHYRAVVRTICNRLEPEEVRAPFLESIGGSTYTFDVGPDHPLEAEVLGLLSTFRAQCHDLRQRVALHNETQGRSPQGQNVVVYVGESVIAREPLAERAP